jgi:hypothetical protein
MKTPLTPKEWVDKQGYPHMKDMMQGYAEYYAREMAVAFFTWFSILNLEQISVLELEYSNIDELYTHFLNKQNQ